MCLAFVLAGRADLLPQEGHGIEAQDVGTLVRPEQQCIEHFDQHCRVPVVEVPLVVVEYRHDPLAQRFVPGEIAGRGLRKDFRHGLFEQVRHIAVFEDVKVILVALFAGPCLPGPLVLVGHVVHHHVERQQHVPFTKPSRQFAQVVEAADAFVDVAVIAYGVAAIAGPRRTLQDGHHVQQVDSQFLQVAEPLAQPLQVLRKGVGIQRHAGPFLAEKPVVVVFALDIELPEFLATLDVMHSHHFDQPQQLLLEIFTLAIQQMEQGMNRVEIRAQPGIEMTQVALANLRLEPIENPVQQRMGNLFVHAGGVVGLSVESGRPRPLSTA